ncbi:exodeoxyribonuclease I [Vibrio sp. D431a]|uniref:exodeoxyribonuclease I n=1 Tax=Vibrio sp. D431a TaxID=2837388 RepID=UPI002555752F|nr:exodeoxyribonuclease I [Vibrio sp. D431a]MDK9790720.1 exodeoxyribonuclease I [Vibrio sp. D431a]
MALNFIFHDYETFGKEVSGASSQWAAITTDADFNIKEVHDIYCKISEDVVPDPVACLITRITPQETLEKGVCEYDFARKVNQVMTKEWESVIVGYNSIGFDDEVTRFLNYRNLIDPYKWAYDKKRSRFDALPLMRLIHALKPEAFKWPIVEKEGSDGVTYNRVSFKLEHLSEINGIVHENAHNAVDDVKALICLVKMAFERAPEISKLYFGMKNKWEAKRFIEANDIFGLCNFRFVDTGYVSPVKRLGFSTKSQNKCWTWNLQVDPTPFSSMSDAELVNAIKMNKEEREKTGTPRSGVVSVKINEVPCIFDSNLLKGETSAHVGLQELREQMYNNALFLDNNPEFVQRVIDIYDNREYEDETTDTDSNLYKSCGGFFTDDENEQIKSFVSSQSWDEKLSVYNNLPEGRIKTMAFRIIGRNAPETFLSDTQLRKEWSNYVTQRFAGKTANCYLSLDDYAEQLDGEEVEKLLQDDPKRKSTFDLLIDYKNTLLNRNKNYSTVAL